MAQSRQRTVWLASGIAVLATSLLWADPGMADALSDPPWRQASPLPPRKAPLVVAAWRRAENRKICAPLAFDPAAVDRRARPRRAIFSGGWGVAWDLPGQRSAFGIAGTGVGPDEGPPWPFRMEWNDGSWAGYGLEGGSGPHHLAYLVVAGQGCLYNVWSALGREHLEQLLKHLRLVNVTSRRSTKGR